MPGGTSPPLSVIHSWPKPNYVNPETRGNAITIYTSIFATFATIFACLRLYSRTVLIRQPGVDDVLVVVGLLFSLFLTALVLLGYYRYGTGTHIWDIPLSKGEPGRLVEWLSLYCTLISTSATKISILLFYRRLATGSFTKGFLWATWAGIAFNTAYCVGFCLYITFQCTPVEAYWRSFSVSWGKSFHCADEGVSIPTSGALSVVGDFYATVLPALLLRHLRIPTMQKILLYSLFGAGFIVVATGIMRTYYSYQLTNETYDVTWTAWSVWIWTLAEMNLAIICASIPALKPLYMKYLSPVVLSVYSLGRSKTSTGNSSSNQEDFNMRLNNIPCTNINDKPSESIVPIKRFSSPSHRNDSQSDRLQIPNETRDLEMGNVASSDTESAREWSRASDEIAGRHLNDDASSGTGRRDVIALPPAEEC